MSDEFRDIEQKVIHDEDLNSLEELGQIEFAKKLKDNRIKAQKAMKTFARDLGNEAKETREASKILVKFLMDGKISPEEEKELKTQVYDLFKMAGIGIPFFLIPGSSLLLPFLIKVASRYGVNLLPTSFDHRNDEEE
ncbi:LETM1 domain-containing protein [Parvicella tangerina]|uniref:Letm1 RBD domain-containing protein n=1 Tax=Parvicella tangerina TaxID=2829795 RepID=A0A916NFA0_9FLAO|nr:LETM1 domain-containing protein [Parvicella tangerina]CAG5078044.1 hypothetical protein CRYO30217_00554 [Parvicella tangerina]